MRRISRLGWILLGVGALAGMVVALLVMARAPSTQSADDALRFRGRAMTIETRITPRLHAFGEPITAEVVAVFNRAQVKADSVRVTARFDPYEQIAREERTREDEGTLTRIRYRFRLQCLSRQCLPGEPKRVIEFEPAGVAYSMIDTLIRSNLPARTAGSGQFPPIEVVSRLDPTATQDVRWRAETRTLPEPSYRVDATVATLALFGGAGALAGLAALVLVPLASRRRHDVAETQIDEDLPALERALLLLETSTNGAVGDRRRALELVARELDAHGEPALAERARRLAWSKDAPEPGDASALAASVRAARAEASE